MSIPWPYAATTALVIFIAASLTDMLDGMIARKYGLITDLGKLLDPLADKILISAAFISLIEVKIAPMWMVVVIIAREFLITGLRVVAAGKHLILAAERAGKHKTVTQIVAIIVSLSYLTLNEFHVGDSFFAFVLKLSLPVLYWLALLITVISGALYFYKNRSLFDRIEESLERPAMTHSEPPPAPMPVTESREKTALFPAFKEWAVIVEALGQGGQIVILRKGGIAEGREGFQIKHKRFWLFPTQYHQQIEKIKPAGLPFSVGLKDKTAGADAGTLELRYFAEITDVRYVENVAQLAAIDDAHLWRDEVIQERFQFGGEPGLHVIVVRVRKLSHPFTLKLDPAFEGCKSWVEVPADFDAESSRPVVPSEEFNTRRGQLLAKLGA